MKINIDHIPNGVSGKWQIDQFEVDGNDLRNKIQMIKTGRGVASGKYKILIHNGATVMSNTPDEIRDHMGFIWAATGSVLINGLGLAMCVTKILEKDDVTDITVIEKEEDVIKLVAPYINDDRVKVIHSCAFDYKPPAGMRYNAVWHDIWTYIYADNIEEMKKLHRKYGRRCDWQGSWSRGIIERQIRQEKKYSYSYF